MKPIPYGRHEITEDDLKAITDSLQSDYLTQGPVVDEFEKKFSEYVNAKYSLAVTNGTAALHLCAMALDIRPGDKVLTTPNTFVASSNCVRYCGGDVEFIDIDPKTYCMDFNKLEAALVKNPKAYKGIIVVDFAGYPVDTEKLRQIADKYNLWIIEDACHAPGARFKNSKGEWIRTGSGHYADLTIFSFHPVKHIATGEGGMITTQRKDLYEKIQILRTHGITKNLDKIDGTVGGWYYEMQELGYNYRIPDVLCALGVSQLARADENLKKRKKIAEKYGRELRGYYETPQVEANFEHAYHLYVIKTEKRKELYNYLKENNIFAQVHYIPVYKQPYYEKTLKSKPHCPEMDVYYSMCLSLPMYPSMTDEQQDYVISKLKNFKNL